MSGLLFSVMKTIGSGLTAQRQRMEAIASNIANAETTKTQDGTPYRRKDVAIASKSSQQAFEIPQELPQIDLAVTSPHHIRTASLPSVRKVVVDDSEVEATVTEAPPDDVKMIYDPQHPDADAKGYVAYPNVNPVEEMVNMLTASRAYQANLASMDAFKSIVSKALEL
ncbi:MAG TPA: flagellar basal body rod protein FlgC [bacterium]|nr:flagellar basal body rod protein FlgC [bacterium]